MKKLALVLAIAMIAAMYVAPVAASDFTAGGSYRAVFATEDPGAANKNKFARQRFRLAFNWAINDNVSAQLRGDFAEFTWGDGYRPDAGRDTLMVDRAWVKIKQGFLTVTVGQQAGGWGLGTLWSDQFAGIQADLDFSPVTVKLLWAKESEGGAFGEVTTDESTNNDDDIYGISVLYGTDTFSGGISFATLQMEDTDTDLNGISFHAVVPIDDMLTLSGAVDYFFGDDVGNADYEGIQAHFKLQAAITEAFNAGVMVVWADDVDNNDTQATVISDDVLFRPLDFDGALAYDRGSYAGGTSIFDVSGDGKGVLGAIANAQFTVSEQVILYGKLAYVQPNEDSGTDLDSKFFAIGNVDYKVMPAVTISGGVAYVKPDYESSATNDDAVVEGILRLGVTF